MIGESRKESKAECHCSHGFDVSKLRREMPLANKAYDAHTFTKGNKNSANPGFFANNSVR